MPDTLLIADHDEALCSTLARELEADGYAVTTATAVRALAVGLANHHPDLLLLGDLDGAGGQARLLGCSAQATNRSAARRPRPRSSSSPPRLASSRCCAALRPAPTTS